MGYYRFCGDSQKGKSHEANGTKCQDDYGCLEQGDFCVAAVADGLGSSKHSDVASSIAAKGSVQYCVNNIRKEMSDNDIIQVISTAFDKVNFGIKQKAGDSLDDYDTTLTLAVFMNGDVYYGHAGDSGIIALRSDGIFEQITEPQLGDGIGKERPVYPLASEAHWVFGKYRHRAKALFLMTDGVLNKVAPPLLEEQVYKLDHAYLYYLYDNLSKNHDLNSWIRGELASILPQEINYDDKTLVAIICDAINLTPQPTQYYEFPSRDLWKSLLEKHEKSLYGYRNDSTPKNNVIAAPRSGGVSALNSNHFTTHNLNYHSQTISNHGNQQKPMQNSQNRKRNPALALSAATFVFGIIVTLIFIFAVNSLNKGDEPVGKQPEAAPTQAAPVVGILTGSVEINELEPRIGDVLLGIVMDDNNTGELSYEWKANGETVGTDRTYIVSLEDLGKIITVEVTSSEEVGTMLGWAKSVVRKKDAPEAPSEPELEEKTHDSIALKANNLYEFSMDGETWSDNNVFSGLEEDMEYSFYQRVKETEDTEPSLASNPISIRTDSAPVTPSLPILNPDSETSSTPQSELPSYMQPDPPATLENNDDGNDVDGTPTESPPLIDPDE